MKQRILFVCLGNICRSCTAEEVMRTVLRREGLDKAIEVDSAGLISYHQGEQADPRMRAHASRRGYHITHLSRPVRMSDFEDFDLVIGMDDSNISRLHELAPSVEAEEKIHRMTEYCTRIVADHVPDPYYGGAQGFENVIDILEDACEGLLATLRQDVEG
ncbi:MAG: low molecular weight phosphotyrosine protein phosphatase [Bacteroidaceae bacterium]|nr:low molecular weight phosphotyrosine protein phosphatase [Bacteroidaceae bacterium]